MSSEQRTVWDEGMMLTPQHFQQWERWVGGELRDRGRSSITYPWGFTTWELDEDALAGGQVALRRCAGFFADGTSFCCPERDALPVPRSVADQLAAGQEHIVAHLALPLPVAGGSEYGDGTAATPFLRQRHKVADAARPGMERDIDIAQPNLSLRFDGEANGGFRTLPLARLQRGQGAGVVLVPGFFPPALKLRAAPSAVGVLRQVAGMVTQKSADLAGQRRMTGGMAEAAGFLLLYTVAGALPGLRHLVENGDAAPESAFLELARLAAQLCTFHGDASPAEVPAYDHGDPGEAFRRLAAMLQKLMGDAAPTRCAEIQLDRTGESLFSAAIPSPDMLSHGRLYLSVKADLPDEEVQARFGAMTKVSSKDKIQDLLIRAVPGLALRVVPQPPQSIPVQPGRSYFVLEPGGEHWDAIASSQTLAIHVAPGLPELKLELLAVKE